MTRALDLEGVPPELGLHRAQAMIERAQASVSRGLRVRQSALANAWEHAALTPLVATLDRAAGDCVACVLRMDNAWTAERSILPDLEALEAAQARFDAAVAAIDALLFRIAPPASARLQ